MLECSDGLVKQLPLRPMAVADFYREFMEMLRSAGVEVSIWRMPVEIPDPIPFDEDRVHAAYDAERAENFLVHPALGGCGFLSVSFGIHRQSEPGAFLLGKF